MAFNVRDFKSNINDFGYIKQNKFEVFIQPPRFLQNKFVRVGEREVSVNDINRLLRFRIEQVRTPSASLLTLDTNRYGIGPSQRMPFNAQYFDTTFAVLVDRNTDLWDFWYNWINGIFNFNGLEPDGNNLFSGGRIPNYTTEYKDEYSTTMMIVIYNDSKEVVKTINLYEAFPSSMRELQLAWNDNTSLMRLLISITYSNYSIVGSNISSNQTTVGRNSSTTATPTIITA